MGKDSIKDNVIRNSVDRKKCYFCNLLILILIMYAGHVIDMQKRMKQNDALRRSRRKAATTKKSRFHNVSAAASKSAIKQSQKWTKKEIILAVIIVFLILTFVMYRVRNPFATKIFF